jgi:hypothetical protein
MFKSSAAKKFTNKSKNRRNMWIEIFRTGKQTDSAGNPEYYTPEMLDEIASAYNNRAGEDESRMAPVVAGHPADDSPALGWVAQLTRRGDRLMAKLTQLDEEFLAGIKSGRYKNVSLALNPNNGLRHIGFLGGAAPAVEGLRSGEYEEGSDYETFLIGDDPGEDSDKRFEEIAAANEKLREKINKMEKESRIRQFRAYVDSLINSEAGSVILPSQADMIIDLMEMAHRADSSSEGGDAESYTEKLKSLLSSLRPRIGGGEFAVGKFREAENNPFEKQNVRPERLDLHEKALRLKSETPGLSYEEAALLARAEV